LQMMVVWGVVGCSFGCHAVDVRLSKFNAIKKS
jgi:hypothetical protein